MKRHLPDAEVVVAVFPNIPGFAVFVVAVPNGLPKPKAMTVFHLSSRNSLKYVDKKVSSRDVLSCLVSIFHLIFVFFSHNRT